jgi:hypothetical protein
MGDTYKPRPEVLQEFIGVLHRFNPMELNLEGNPGAEDEYDSEALSILSRIHERAIQSCPYTDRALDMIVGIIQETFRFWFGEPIRDEMRAKELAYQLLVTYDASFPSRAGAEHVPPPEVVSGNEERVGDGGSGLPRVPPGEASPGNG